MPIGMDKKRHHVPSIVHFLASLPRWDATSRYLTRVSPTAMALACRLARLHGWDVR